MKRPSFRLRIASLSAALAGSTLVGFAAVSWFQIYNAQISRLDAQLLNQLLRGAPKPETPPRSVRAPFPAKELKIKVTSRSDFFEHGSFPDSSQRERWHFYAESLSYAFGTNTKIPIALLMLDANGNTLYQSQEVLADQDVNRLLVERLRLTPLVPPFKGEPPPKPENRNSDQERSPFIRPPQLQFVTLTTATKAWRIGAVKFPHIQVAIAVSLQAVNQEMATINNIFAVSIPAALLLVASGAWFISGSARGPIRRLTGVIQQVSVKGLDQRIEIGTTDIEFVELIQVFNQMLERLERSFTQASRFSADAAHELKTPLTILQGELERTLQQVEPGSQVQQRLSNLLDEVHRLSAIIRKLLLLSLADAGKMSLYKVEVDVSELLMEMVEDLELLAPDLAVQTEITDKLRIQGDRDLLIQVLQNLFNNAIKYNLANGWIKIHAYQTQTTLYVTIANASIEIPLSDKERIFDRFHRVDPARTRKVEGIGLGLSLAREIARAHNGNLTLDSTSNGQTAFTLTLPITL
ncbi:MAG: HAMP domain-containing histidine kinase [Hassallia sp. WJT32-NPBG1]|jgi:heavy metal sensor kinase|nr:HAMP domain-containing histidine kinase [Hassallia sp. WJT32-NPBG1]